MFGVLVRDRPGGTPLLRVGECIPVTPPRANPPPVARFLLCLPYHLPCCLCSQSASPPLSASLTGHSGPFSRLLEPNIEPRLQSLLCDYTTDVPLPAVHQAIRSLGDTTEAAPGHLCDTWRWLTLEGELSAVSDLQVMLTTNGVVLSVTADVKISMGGQIITHCPAAMAQSLPLLALAKTADATSRELLLRWNPYFRRIHGNSSGLGGGNWWGSRK